MKHIEYEALHEAAGEEALTEWLVTGNEINKIIADKFKSLAKDGKVSGSHIAAAITVLSEVAATLIKLSSDKHKTREVLKEAFSEGMDYWLEREDKEPKIMNDGAK